MERFEKEKEHFEKRKLFFEKQLEKDPSNKVSQTWVEIYKEKVKRVEKMLTRGLKKVSH